VKTTFRITLIVIVVICVTCVVIVNRFQSRVQAQPPSASQLEYRVDHTVRERGIVESGNSIDIRCEASGTNTILSIVPEGTLVEEGDLLVELDDTLWREKLTDAETLVEQSTLQVAQAEAELASVEAEGAATIQFAEKALEAAVLSRERELAEGGVLDCELAAINSQLAVARERLRTAEKLMDQTPENRGSTTPEELLLAQVEAREAIRVAEARKLLLEKYERKSRTTTLNLAVAEKEMLRERQKQAFAKAQRIAEAGLVASRSALSRDRQNLELIRQHIARCKIYSPRAGVVLHVTPNTSRGSRGPAIGEGMEVRQRQTLLQLPDLARLRVKVSVNESRIARVKAGQPATIEVDAFSDRRFRGKVIQVSSLPEPTSWLNGDVKEYAVLVSIEEPTDALRVGMTALVEIDVDDRRMDRRP
jgi:HlyD family secretion protein